MSSSDNSNAAELERLSAFAHKLADLSEQSILPHFRARFEVQNKAQSGQFDPVTEADLKAEKAIREAIAEAFPDHGIIGEEFGADGADAAKCWVIDPIDGTKSFVTGSPLWGTLIGLLENGKPKLGLMNQPFTGERYWSDGRGAYGRNRIAGETRLETRRCSGLSDAVMTTTSIDLLEPGFERERFDALSERIRMRRFGGDCYAYCLLAAGQIDLVVETGLNPHDIVALIPIIEHAGGTVSQWDGGDAARGGRIVAAGDTKLHAAAMDMLTRQN